MDDGKYLTFDFTIKLEGNPLSGYIDKDYKCPVVKDYYEYKYSSTDSQYFIYCPTYNSTLKHKNNRGTINKVVFSPKYGIIINY